MRKQLYKNRERDSTKDRKKDPARNRKNDSIVINSIIIALSNHIII